MSLNPNFDLSDESHALWAAVLAAKAAVPLDPLDTARWVVGMLGTNDQSELALRMMTQPSLRQELVSRRRQWEAYARGIRTDEAGTPDVQEVWESSVGYAFDLLSPESNPGTRLKMWGAWLRTSILATASAPFAATRSVPALPDSPTILEVDAAGSLHAVAAQNSGQTGVPHLMWRDPGGGGFDFGPGEEAQREWTWTIPEFALHTSLREEELMPEQFQVAWDMEAQPGYVNLWLNEGEGRRILTQLRLLSWPEVTESGFDLELEVPASLLDAYPTGSLTVAVPVLDLEIVVAVLPLREFNAGVNHLRIQGSAVKVSKFTSASLVILTLSAI